MNMQRHKIRRRREKHVKNRARSEICNVISRSYNVGMYAVCETLANPGPDRYFTAAPSTWTIVKGATREPSTLLGPAGEGLMYYGASRQAANLIKQAKKRRVDHAFGQRA